MAPRTSPPQHLPRPVALATTTAGALALLLLAVGPATAGGIGPDVTVHDMDDTDHFGPVSGVHAYSIATRSCNQGDVPLNWCDELGGCGNGTTSADHPVIAQNLYRLNAGRFTQIGMSWLKHGFSALQQAQPGCGNGTCQATNLNFLGVGCTDPYTAGLNGNRPLGLRSEVNATTGEYPFPYTEVGESNVLDQRIRVAQSDLDPTLNPGARYWIEGHYVAPDDATAGNGLNNASHREVAVLQPSYGLSFLAPTVREQPAIAAWQAVDPIVERVDVDVPGAIAERFHVARRVTDLGGGSWHYEYAVHNHNAHRAAHLFSVSFPTAATISNAGFHSVDHHSGEVYATTPWDIDTSTPGTVTWSTDDFATDPNANALRWGTMFSFWFDATAEPAGITHTLALFRPGSPDEVSFPILIAIFADGFESGTTGQWSGVVGE